MKRDEDTKPKPKPQPVYERNGKLTEEGKQVVFAFRHTLVPDPDGQIREWDMQSAVNERHGFFPFDPLFKDIVCNPKSIWPHLNDDAIEFVQVDTYNGSFYRARFEDELGVEDFNPREAEGVEVEYLVDELLPLHGVHMFVAKPEALKTWLAYRIAIDVTRGDPVLGRWPARKGRAVLIDFEIGRKELDRRLRMLGADERVKKRSYPPYDLNSPKFWTELAKLQARFIVIDGLGSGQSGGFGELDSRFADPLGTAARFAEEHECTILFIYHSPKAASLADVESLFRGTGAIRSKVDSAYYFRRLPDGPDNEVRAEVTSVKSRKGAGAERFCIQVTDERGVELFDQSKEAAAPEPEAPELTDEEKVLNIIRTEPGMGFNRIQGELEMRRETLADLLERLKADGRVRAEVGGKGRPTAYFAIETGSESGSE